MHTYNIHNMHGGVSLIPGHLSIIMLFCPIKNHAHRYIRVQEFICFMGMSYRKEVKKGYLLCIYDCFFKHFAYQV